LAKEKIKIKYMIRICLTLLFIYSQVLMIWGQGLEKIIVEKYYISDSSDAHTKGGYLPVGSTTYRVYADMKKGYRFQAAFGITSHELKIATSTTFYNNEYKGGTFANDILRNELRNNTVMLDSWISVGAGSEGNYGIMKIDDDGKGTVVNTDVPKVLQNADRAAGIPLKSQDGLLAAPIQAVVALFGIDTLVPHFFGVKNHPQTGQIFSTNNGSWASFGGAIGPNDDNKVLIAQITTNGVLEFELNVQIGTPSGGVEQYVAKNRSGIEFQLPSLSYPPKNLAPKVEIMSPLMNKIFEKKMPIPLEAFAYDSDGTISKMEFFVNEIKVGEDNSSPFQMTWNGPVGKSVLTAVATDDYGAKSVSAPVTFFIK
jgi:hypothetical protein